MGVTIVAGTSTVAQGTAGITYATATATSICSSLSNVACGSLQSNSNVCSATGTTAGFVIGTSANAAGPTAMPCMGLVAGVAAGVGFGMMGI